MVDQGRGPRLLVRSIDPRDGYTTHDSIGDAVVFGLAYGRCGYCRGPLPVTDVGLASFSVIVAPSLDDDDPDRYVTLAHQGCGDNLRRLIRRRLDGDDS